MPKTKASLCVIAATICTVIVLFVLPITPKLPVSTAVVQRGNLVRTQAVEGLVCYQSEQPCLTPLAGQVAQVYVRQGQRVQKGEPLLRLSTALEEETLQQLEKAVYQQEQSVSAIAVQQEAVQAVWLQNKLSMESQMRELTLAIAAKTLRAPADGMVGQVYAAQDQYVGEMTPLLTVHSDALEVRAQQRMQESASLRVGTRALVYAGADRQATATLTAFDLPTLDSVTGQYLQTLHFAVDEGGEWLGERIGDAVSMEILFDVEQDVAVAPLAAVSENSLLWLVTEGKVSSLKIDPEKRDEDFVRVPEELVGQKVVLLPDDQALRPGSLVKETRK